MDLKLALEKLNQDSISKEVSLNIVNECGYPIGLSGNEGANTFNSYFKSIQKYIINQEEKNK